MSSNSMRKYVENRLIDKMALLYPTWGVKVPNVKFEVPNQYVDYFLLEGDSMQIILGNKTRVRQVGVLQIDVYVQEDSGMGDMNDVAQYVADTFMRRAARLEDSAAVTFKVPVFKDMGKFNGFYRKIVSVPWFRDEPPIIVQLSP